MYIHIKNIIIIIVVVLVVIISLVARIMQFICLTLTLTVKEWGFCLGSCNIG